MFSLLLENEASRPDVSMSQRRDAMRGAAPMARIRDNSRLMHTHESMVDYLNGRHQTGSFLDVFAPNFFGKMLSKLTLAGLNFLRNFDGSLDEDLIYSDEDDDDDDYYDHFRPPYSHIRPLQPHPRIRQLTEEEADRHAKELIEEEERNKQRTERNKRKKMRKKEKKRLEKENAAKNNIAEENQRQSDSSENQDENPKSKSQILPNGSSESGETQNGPEAAGPEQSRKENKEENLLEINNKEKVQKDLELNNSNSSTEKTEPKETSNQQPAKERKKDKVKQSKIQQPKKEKPTTVEKPEVQKKIEEKPPPANEEKLDPAAEEFARKSGELASSGTRLAASGQYEMAVKYFTDAIKYNPREYRLFGNRSLCYERMEQYENALRDAESALSIEPSWVRGLFRKGKALCGLKRYYEASLIYNEVLKLQSSSDEAKQELKRAQTLHLIEMGFSWTESSDALKTHATLEEAIEALFGGHIDPSPADGGANGEITNQPAPPQEEDEDDGWTVLGASRPRTQQVKESETVEQARSKSQSPTPKSKSSGKPPLLSVWVGALAPTITYSTLHEVFSRAGTVHSIKMLLEQHCAFINYTRKEDCDRAVQCINGMVIDGFPLCVQHPSKANFSLCSQKKECFFWRTSGCTRQDCTFLHVPENKNIDKARFTSRLGNFHM